METSFETPKKPAGRPALITLTDAAAERIRELMENASDPVEGIRVGVKKGGCSGFKYTFDYVNAASAGDEIIETKGVKVFIDPAATLYLIGTEMDFVEDKFSSSFVFNNPNKKASCGCGESFNV